MGRNRWIGPKLYRPRLKIYTSRKSTKSLGSETQLYTAGWTGFDDPFFVEKGISKLEDAAARVKDKLLAYGVESLTDDDRKTFAFFISLLLVRHPAQIHPRIELAAEDWGRRVDELVRKQLQFGPLTRAQSDYFVSIRAEHARDLVFQAMLEVARQHAETWYNFPWRMFDVTAGGISLVLGDRPLNLSSNEGRLACLQIPLSPNILFVAGTLPEWQEIKFQPKFRQALAIDAISDQFKRADRFVIAKDAGNDGCLIILADRLMKSGNAHNPCSLG